MLMKQHNTLQCIISLLHNSQDWTFSHTWETVAIYRYYMKKNGGHKCFINTNTPGN